ncbi:MAG: universal stress protein [Burkholderiaceae bacterium]
MFKHLLIPVDGTDLAERAMQAGIDLARQLDASITAFIAEPPAPGPNPGRNALAYPREVEQHNQATAEHAQAVLGNFERRAAAAGVPFTGVHSQAYRIDEEIADTARERGCDMIVMVTHGRGIFGELLFGSRTKGVMALSKVPLLVLH